MADEQKPAGEGVQNPPAGEGNKPVGGEQPKTGQEEGQDPNGKKPEGEKPEGEKPKEEQPKGDGDGEPPIRPKSPLQHILDRKNRQIEKLKSQQPSDKKEDEEISPEDEELVMKVINKNLGGKLAADADKELQMEVKEFIGREGQEHFKPFEAKILKWAKSSAYANVPIEQVAYAACGADLIKLGAQKKAEADNKADSSGAGGGGSARPAGGAKDWSKASNQEVEAEIQRQLNGAA